MLGSQRATAGVQWREFTRPVSSRFRPKKIKMVSLAILEVLGRVAGPVLRFILPKAWRWSRRYNFPAASTNRLSILVARVSGDNAGQSNYHSIREAIRETLPEVSVYAWPEELEFRDGEDRASQAVAQQVARRWLEDKKCDLLIAARMKSPNVIQLRFIPAMITQSAGTKTDRPITYALPVETMDLPANFTNDLAGALGGCIIPYLATDKRSPSYLQALSRLIGELEKMLSGATAITDARTRATIVNSYSVARATNFELSGNVEDLKIALDELRKVSDDLAPDEYPIEWSCSKANYGAALVRLGGIGNDIGSLQQGIAALHSALPKLTAELVQWSKVQLMLACAYDELARLTGSTKDLSSSIEVCLQLTTQELLDQEPTLWAAVKDQLGRTHASLGDTQPNSDALLRSVDAFTDALEIWTVAHPEMRAATLGNLSRTLIALGTRQNSADMFNEAVLKLREAKHLVSKRHHLRIWTTIQLNLGIALSMIGEADPRRFREAVKILREARELTPRKNTERRDRATVALAKALMLSGRVNEKPDDIEEAVSLIKDLQLDEPALQLEVRNNLGLAYYCLGRLSESIPHLETARELLTDLLDDYSEISSPFGAAQTQQALGITLREIGRLKQSIPTIDKSIVVLEGGLAFATQESAPIFWAAVHYHLAESYLERAQLDRTQSSLEAATDHMSQALSVLGPSSSGSLTAQARKLALRISEFRNEDRVERHDRGSGFGEAS